MSLLIWLAKKIIIRSMPWQVNRDFDLWLLDLYDVTRSVLGIPLRLLVWHLYIGVPALIFGLALQLFGLRWYFNPAWVLLVIFAAAPLINRLRHVFADALYTHAAPAECFRPVVEVVSSHRLKHTVQNANDPEIRRKLLGL